MFWTSILGNALPSDSDAVVTPVRRVSWRELRSLISTITEDLAQFRGARVGVVMRPLPESIAVVAALEALEAEAVLLAEDTPEEMRTRQALELKLQALLTPKDGEAVEPMGRPAVRVTPLVGGTSGRGCSSVTILSSGTTGAPKAVRHTWQSLMRPVRRPAGAKRQRWLLTYRLDLYAGLQVVLQCLPVDGTLFIPEPGCSVVELVGFLKRERIGYVSATPSYWRRLLLQAERDTLRQLEIRQITLGGEIADQPLLDALRERFPSARVTHIYATTELGRCFAVTDGRAGFPATFLDEPTSDGPALRIEDGELLARSANAMEGYDDALQGADPAKIWHHTGDLVERVGDRVTFVGRVGELVNVGGNKINPLAVERILRGVPGVADVRVYGRRSSITGQLVACEIVVAAGAQRSEVEAAVGRVSAEQLTSWQRPRVVDFVNAIRLTPAGKTSRRPE